MSEDPDFHMEVVEDNELDELGADGASSSDMRPASQTVRKGEDTTEEGGSKMEVKETEERGTLTSGKGSDRKKTASGRSAEKYMTDPGATQLERDAFGSLPSGWEYGKTGEWLQYIRSGISESQNQDEEGIPVTRIETISDGTVDYEKVGYVDLDPEEAKADRLKSGDLLFSNINSREQIGKTAVYKEEGTLYHGMNLLRLRYVDDVLQPLFAYYLYDSPMAKDIFFRLSQAAVGQSSINQGQLKNLSLPRPPLPEQRKIASVLHAVDQAIQKTEAIIEQAKRVKRGLMQELLQNGLGSRPTEIIRLSAVDSTAPEHWSVVTIGEVARKITDGAHLTPDRTEDGYLLLSARNVKNGYLDLSEVDHVPEEEYQRLTEKCHPESGDVLISCSGTVGRVCLVPEDMEFAMVRSAALVKLGDDVLPEYMEQVLQGAGVQKQIKGYQTQSAQPNLFQGQIARIEIPVPPKDEQKKISKVLRDWDSSVRQGVEYKDKLQRLKKGLMQDLLTGEVRTVDKAIEVLGEVNAHG